MLLAASQRAFRGTLTLGKDRKTELVVISSSGLEGRFLLRISQKKVFGSFDKEGIVLSFLSEVNGLNTLREVFIFLIDLYMDKNGRYISAFQEKAITQKKFKVNKSQSTRKEQNKLFAAS